MSNDRHCECEAWGAMECLCGAWEGAPDCRDPRTVCGLCMCSHPCECLVAPETICKLKTWCVLPAHDDTTPCHEKPRAAMDRTDFGPRRAVKVGWR